MSRSEKSKLKVKDKSTLKRALSVLTRRQFVYLYEWVCNGWPLITGEEATNTFVNEDGDP